MSTDLNSQIAELTAIENIKKLKAIYCSYCDNNYDPEGLASLFVEDGIWDGGPEFGRHVGKQAIKKFFDGALKKFGVNSPADFKSDEEKKKFFDYVDKNYDAKNEGTLPPALQKAIDKKKEKEEDKEVDEGATPSKKFVKIK